MAPNSGACVNQLWRHEPSPKAIHFGFGCRTRFENFHHKVIIIFAVLICICEKQPRELSAISEDEYYRTVKEPTAIF
ncbi:acetyl-CoA transporter [Anopheles sinensis]|uniref:Acetyl-CoA transporter n=1 Tax=Anopheles sinensis TaxID=74873 RepID=A0A084VWS8_ANOSI|nr:acetyl-CoA transporter [Anopheles sinensis]